jgi:hypothetical protein
MIIYLSTINPILNPSEVPEFSQFLCGFHVVQSLVFCIVCPSPIYGFWLLLWHLQTVLEQWDPVKKKTLRQEMINIDYHYELAIYI